MTTDMPDGISVRPASIAKRVTEQDTSAGLSQNGTTHTTPENVNNSATFKRYYVDPGTEPTLDQKRDLVENLDTLLSILPQAEHAKLIELIEEYRTELANSSTGDGS